MNLYSCKYLGISQARIFLRAPSNPLPALQNTYDDLTNLLSNYYEIGELEKGATHGQKYKRNTKFARGNSFNIEEEISLNMNLLNVNLHNWGNLREYAHNKACDILVYDEKYRSDTAEQGRVILYKNVIIRISTTCTEQSIYKINLKFNFKNKNSNSKFEMMDIINGYADNMSFFGQYISSVNTDNGNMAFFGSEI